MTNLTWPTFSPRHRALGHVADDVSYVDRVRLTSFHVAVSSDRRIVTCQIENNDVAMTWPRQGNGCRGGFDRENDVTFRGYAVSKVPGPRHQKSIWQIQVTDDVA